jgi:acyl-CoA reductase-like NAD-dependent aldehyde dehydrogenase
MLMDGFPEKRQRRSRRSKGQDVKTYLNFIDGKFVRGSAETFANHFPSTGEVIGEISAAGRTEVDAAVGAARAALKGPWGRMPLAERVALLQGRRWHQRAFRRIPGR